MHSRTQRQEPPRSKRVNIEIPDQEIQQADARRPQRNVPHPDPSSPRLKFVTVTLALVSSFLLVATIRLGVHQMSTQTTGAPCGDSERNFTEMQKKVKCLEKAVREAELGRKCPPNWWFINDKCYYVSNEKKTKEQSDRFCVENGATLATVKGNDVILQLKNMNSAYWVGLTQKKEVHDGFTITVWTWSDGTSQYFPDSEPGHCAALNRSIVFTPCDSPLRWICGKGMVENNLYEKMRSC